MNTDLSTDDTISLKRRFAAFLIDCCIIGFLIKVTYSTMLLFIFGIDFYVWGVIALYFVALTSSPLQSTIGQLILGLKVQSSKGLRPKLWQSFIRLILSVVASIILLWSWDSSHRVKMPWSRKSKEDEDLHKSWDWLALAVSKTELIKRSA